MLELGDHYKHYDWVDCVIYQQDDDLDRDLDEEEDDDEDEEEEEEEEKDHYFYDDYEFEPVLSAGDKRRQYWLYSRESRFNRPVFMTD